MFGFNIGNGMAGLSQSIEAGMSMCSFLPKQGSSNIKPVDFNDPFPPDDQHWLTRIDNNIVRGFSRVAPAFRSLSGLSHAELVRRLDLMARYSFICSPLVFIVNMEQPGPQLMTPAREESKCRIMGVSPLAPKQTRLLGLISSGIILSVLMHGSSQMVFHSTIEDVVCVSMIGAVSMMGFGLGFQSIAKYLSLSDSSRPRGSGRREEPKSDLESRWQRRFTGQEAEPEPVRVPVKDQRSK